MGTDRSCWTRSNNLSVTGEMMRLAKMKQSLALMLVLIVVIGGPSPGAENYRVGATNDLGAQYSNESKDQVRFAVIDLGTVQKPLRVTNSGIVLFESNPFIGKRWTAGTLETLSAGTVADINEQ